MLSDAVKAFIRANGLLKESGRYIVALSGGADSVALMLVLRDLGYHIEAAHCNFHLRGDESDRDEKFCRALCESIGVRIHITHFDTRKYASDHKVSIEMAARELRYDYFERLRRELEADDVCVAHHRDDSVETILLNLIRGTGILGLTGIQPRNGHIVRPLLCAGRAEIEDYLNRRGQAYVTDSTNLEDDVQRNKIRLNVIPRLKEINPRAVENIYRSSKYLLAVQKTAFSAIDNRFEQSSKRSSAVLKAALSSPHNRFEQSSKRLSADLKTAPSPELVIWYALRDKHFSAEQIEEMAKAIGGQSGRVWRSSTHIVATDRDGLVIEELKKLQMVSLTIAGEGSYDVPQMDEKLRVNVREMTSGFKISHDRNVCMLDFDKVRFPLELRNYRDGESFMPFGMRGRKLISDFLTDLKLNVLQKMTQLIVADCNGNIVWVVGQRPDNRFRITDDTRRVLVLQWK